MVMYFCRRSAWIGGTILNVPLHTRRFAARVGRLGNLLTLTGALVISTPFSASPASASSRTSYAYVANAGSSTVSVIDTATNAVVNTVPVGTNPYGVAVTPDHMYAYVTNSNF